MTEVKIDRLGHKGDGIARGPVFAARTLPGEVVVGEIAGDRIVSPKISTPSPDRVTPKCRHYTACGGCALQHASDAFVTAWKADIVRVALAAQGLPAPIQAIHTSPPASRRRATFTGRRTKKGALVGFHALASDVITGVPDCRVLRPALVALLPHLERLTGLVASRKGEVRFAVTETETGIDLAVTGGKPLDLALRETLAAFAEAVDLARISWDKDLISERRAPVIRFGNAPVPIAPGAFLQATNEGEAALQSAVEAALGKPTRVVDLFAGCGTFALWLARRYDVHAVEGDADLLAALDAGWRHGTRLHKVTTEARDLVHRPMMPEDLKGIDGVVIDPPRAGAEIQMTQIAAARIPRVASVSCNPVTFARDSAILTGAGYTLDRIDVVDQFRWSPHVELVGAFSLA